MNLREMNPKAYDGNKPYIFVSYAHKNANAAGEYVKSLQDSGVRLWFDEGINVGSEWSAEIEDHLKKNLFQ